jgi:hypothetical protein
MDLWPRVLNAPLTEAPLLLQGAALQVLQPWPLALIAGAAGLLLFLCRRLWSLGGPWRVAAAAVGTTLAVDALFLGASLLAPHLSGLI